MILDLGQVVEIAKSRERQARAISRLILTEPFAEFWDQTNTDERTRVIQLVCNQQHDSLVNWAKSRRRRELADKTVLELRAMARSFGIERPHQLPKYLLVMYVAEGMENDRQRNASEIALGDERTLPAIRDWQSSVQTELEQSERPIGGTSGVLQASPYPLDRVQTDLGSAYSGTVGTTSDFAGWQFAGAESAESGQV